MWLCSEKCVQDAIAEHNPDTKYEIIKRERYEDQKEVAISIPHLLMWDDNPWTKCTINRCHPILQIQYRNSALKGDTFTYLWAKPGTGTRVKIDPSQTFNELGGGSCELTLNKVWPK